MQIAERMSAAVPLRQRRVDCGPPVEEVTWADYEIAGCTFKDARLGCRFGKLLKRIGSAMGKSIPLVCQDWANTKAAYRFLANERVSEADILGGHFHSTCEHLRCWPVVRSRWQRWQSFLPQFMNCCFHYETRSSPDCHLCHPYVPLLLASAARSYRKEHDADFGSHANISIHVANYTCYHEGRLGIHVLAANANGFVDGDAGAAAIRR